MFTWLKGMLKRRELESKGCRGPLIRKETDTKNTTSGFFPPVRKDGGTALGVTDET